MEKVNKFMEQLNREITKLENEIKSSETRLKESIEGSQYNIIQFGLARDAEKLTIAYAKLQSLYDQKDAFQSIFLEELEA